MSSSFPPAFRELRAFCSVCFWQPLDWSMKKRFNIKSSTIQCINVKRKFKILRICSYSWLEQFNFKYENCKIMRRQNRHRGTLSVHWICFAILRYFCSTELGNGEKTTSSCDVFARRPCKMFCEGNWPWYQGFCGKKHSSPGKKFIWNFLSFDKKCWRGWFISLSVRWK